MYPCPQSDPLEEGDRYTAGRSALRNSLLRFIQSGQVLKVIFGSVRMHWRNKMILLKFLGRVEEIAWGEGGKGWKVSPWE